MRFLVGLLFISTSALAGDSTINVTGTDNIITFNQIANSTASITAVGNYSDYTINQVGGGNHNAQVQLNGNFNNYIFSLTQNSNQNLSISITQTCPTSTCSPAPYSFVQY